MADPNVITPEAAQGSMLYFGFAMPPTPGSSVPISPLTANSATFPTPISAGGNVFHFHITLSPFSTPSGFTQPSIPIIATPSPPPDAALRELELKQQLHQRRLTQGSDHHFMSSHRSSVSNTSLTPSASVSNSQSDHYSSDAMDSSAMEDGHNPNHNTVDRGLTERIAPPRERGQDTNLSPRDAYGLSHSDQDKDTPMLCQTQNITKQDTRRVYSTNEQRSQPSPLSTPAGKQNPTSMDTRKRQDRIVSRSTPSLSPTRSDWEESRSTAPQPGRARTPPGSPPRHRSVSPHHYTSTRHPGSDDDRGRTRYSKSIRSSSPSARSDRSYTPSVRDDVSFQGSPRARQRSLPRTERSDSIVTSRSSRSRNDLIVSKESSKRSRSNSTNRSRYQEDTLELTRNNHYDRNSENRVAAYGVPLTSRIESVESTAHADQRDTICPFYHPGSQKHPIGSLHPGYGPGEFEEIKAIWFRGGTVPPGLLKQGDSINYRQRPDTTPFPKPKFNPTSVALAQDNRPRNRQRRFSHTETRSNNPWQANNNPGYVNRNARAGSFTQPRYAPQSHPNLDMSYGRPDPRSLRSPVNRQRHNYQPYSRQNVSYREQNFDY